MYEKLVENLRGDFGREYVEDAANAIESLSDGYNRLSKHMDDLETLLPKWIPVSERVPDNIGEEVLVCTEEYGKSDLGFATVAVYDGNEWLECWQRKTYLTAVTHWMPLPSKPEEHTNDR